jgi:transcriptional regulator with PAS, ATPase and Fis domain
MKLDPSEAQVKTLFEAVLNTVSDAITVIDKDLKVIFQNEAVHRMYGSKLGEHCFEAYRGRKEPCENCIILEVIKDGKRSKRALNKAEKEMLLADLIGYIHVLIRIFLIATPLLETSTF